MSKRDQQKREPRMSWVEDPTRKIGPGMDSDVVEGDAELPLKRAEALQTPPISDEAAANRIAILESPSYKLAEVDIDFLGRKENRTMRMQIELLKTETLLREQKEDAKDDV